MATKKNQDFFCTYCGKKLKKNQKTMDHVPPKNLFTLKERSKVQLIKVPSCFACNNGDKSKDEHAKHVLNLCVAQMLKDTPDQLAHYKKTLDKNCRLSKDVESSRLTLIQDTITRIITPEYVVPIPKKYEQDLYEVLVRSLKGLYYHHFKKRLCGSKFSVHPFSGFDLSGKKSIARKIEELKIVLDLQKNSKKYVLLSKVITYWLGKCEDSDRDGVFLFGYRDAVVFVVIFSSAE